MERCAPRIFLILSWVSLASGAGFAGSSADPRPLRPAAAIEREMAAGEIHLYRAELPAGGTWRIVVEQQGIDVTVAATAPDGLELEAVDSPLDRRGTESLVVLAAARGGPLVEVRSREPSAPPGRYVLQLEALGDDSPEDHRRLAAETARMRAAQLYAAERRGAALAAYQEALDRWRELGRPEDEARELYCVAVLRRLVGETRQALDLDHRALTLWRRLGDRYWEAATLNEIGLNHWTLGKSREARDFFGQALEVRRQIGDRFGEVKTRNNICLTLLTRGELRRGLRCYQPLIEALGELREPQLTATVHTNAGWAWDRLGEVDRALEHYERALELHRLAGDRQGEAQALNNLGWLRHGTGQVEEALASYDRALAIFRELEDARWQGIVLHNLGLAYGVLGEPRRALAFLERALPVRRRAGHRRGEVATLNSLGLIQSRLSDPGVASAYHRQALDVARALGDPRLEAIARQMFAATRLVQDEPREALEQAERALELVRGVEDRASQAAALDLIGRARASLGEIEPAMVSLAWALELRRAIRDPDGEAQTRTFLARIERAAGRLDSARAEVEAALGLIEGLRDRVRSTDLRATFQSTHRAAYELHVDVLMGLDRERPGQGYERQALAASERARGRSFLDLLHETGGGVRSGIDPALREQRAALERRLSAKAARRSELAGGADEGGKASALELEIAEILHGLERLDAEIRGQSPRYAELTRPRLLDASGIQALLDRETALLSYLLGEERSFLWWVTPVEVVAFELPRRARIEAAARRLHRHLSTADRQDRRERPATADELGRMLLRPVRDRLGDRRLVVIADGALHYLPFAALPDPKSGEPLVRRHEIVHLPSASVLSTLRRELAGRSPAPRWLAILADPVLERGDPRFAAAAPARAARSRDPPMRSGADVPSLGRLRGSRREAESIAALAPAGEVLMALGFKASRATVLGSRMRPYRLVHFATHGVVDSRTPRLSGLLLSRFDERGRPREGFLRLPDIYDLELGCELVVLSGCQTALGKEIRGEGLVGLVRGFMYAGTPRVVASLWRVEDRATAELMTRFYRAMALDGLPPAAALRTAQLSLRQERRWKDPYYWAGFVLVGEWNGALSLEEGETPRGVVPLSR